MEELNSQLKNRLRKFIDLYSDDIDIQFDPKIDLPLPFSKPIKEGAKNDAAHYFLLAASINDIEVAGNARNVRVLLAYFYEKLKHKENLFTITDPAIFEKAMEGCDYLFGSYSPLGTEKAEIPKILVSVNLFVKNRAPEGLIAYSKGLSENGQKPVDMVNALSEDIERMDGYNLAKAWLYMRWMVRKWPDLGLFDSFSPADLQIPLTIPTLRVAKILNLAGQGADEALESRRTLKEWWDKNPIVVQETSERLTRVADQLCPGDPAKADYPFFILGRWLSGLELNEETMIKTLDLFEQQRQKLHSMFGKKYKPIQYLVIKKRRDDKLVARTVINKISAQTSLENEVMKILKDANIHTDHEPLAFNLPMRRDNRPDKPVTYTPDFIVRSKRVKGKKVALEPHGVWDQSVKKDVEKWLTFLKIYGEFCELRIIVRDEMAKSTRELVPRQIKERIWGVSNFKKRVKEEFD